MGAAKKTSGTEPPRDSDLKARMERLKETLPEDPAPPPPKTDVIPYTPGNPTRKAIAAAAREKYKPVPVLRTLADIEPDVFTWMWQGRLPEDRVSIIMGEPESGKSTLWTWLASVVTTGGRWPDGPRYMNPGSVLIIQSEEMASKEIRERIENFGGDPLKVHFMDGVTVGDSDEVETVSLAHHVPAIEAALDQFGDVRLIVVDPLGEFMDGLSGFTEGEVRKLLRPLRMMTERRKVAVILMAHMTKDDEADITKRLMGSAAFLAIARMAWFLSDDPYDLSRKCLSYFKGNALDKITTGLSYGLNAAKDKLAWCREPMRLHARQVDNALKQLRRRESGLPLASGPASTKTEAAMAFILMSVASGPKLQSATLKEALAAGITESVFNEALARLRGVSDDEDVEIEAKVFRDKRDPRGKKHKHYWLRLIAPPLLPDAVTPVDPLDAWMDDGGAPGRTNQ